MILLHGEGGCKSSSDTPRAQPRVLDNEGTFLPPHRILTCSSRDIREDQVKRSRINGVYMFYINTTNEATSPQVHLSQAAPIDCVAKC